MKPTKFLVSGFVLIFFSLEATRRRASTGSEHKPAAEISWNGGDTSDGQVTMECYRWKVCAEKSWRGSKLES